jgi:RNA 2',3'-cyclic 3'-phosphodiesterase
VKWRTFIAIRVEPTAALAALIHDLSTASHGPDARAIRPIPAHNLHLTLRFLGDVDADSVPAIGEAMRRAAAAHASFDLRWNGVGVFPSLRRPNVVWVGTDDHGASERLVDALSRELTPLGIASEDRAWRPHLTIARIKAKPSRELKAWLDAHRDEAFGATRVEKVLFIRSELLPEGPRYTELSHATLRP